VSSILITAGPTREKIDPVRFISNYSTGRFGYEIAKEAKRRGHKVTLVSGPTSLARPKGIRFIAVESARDMMKVLSKEFPGCGCLIMAAAVSDWRVKSAAKRKIKRGPGGKSLELMENPDIVKALARRKGRRVVAGFALETEDLARDALKKLKAKNLDIIIANKLAAGAAIFGDNPANILIMDRFGRRVEVRRRSKKYLAKIILDKVLSFNINLA